MLWYFMWIDYVNDKNDVGRLKWMQNVTILLFYYSIMEHKRVLVTNSKRNGHGRKLIVMYESMD